MTWKTRIALIRELPAGHGISYGRTEDPEAAHARWRPWHVDTRTVIRARFQARARMVLVHGTRCPVLGRVTMDQIMVDVTDLATPARSGDEVVLLGAQEGEFISATELAQKAGTIAWHVFTGITARVERSYVGVQASA